MSIFYIAPVKGHMPVHLLETIIMERLEYLKQIFRGDSAVYNEYIVDGSVYDNVGHFMLCVVTILAENVGVSKFFLKAEAELFKRRLESLTAYDMRSFAKKLLRSLKKHQPILSFLEPLQVLCQHFMLKEISQHVCFASHLNSCATHIIKINFWHCLTYVGKRQVEIIKGIAQLPCGLWKQYLTNIFIVNLKYRISKTNLKPLKNDPRIMELLNKLKLRMPFTNNESDTAVLLCKDVNHVSKFFPLCMLNLHQNLRKKHRLSHHQRFYYSLFLKDIGMPVEEAIDFWRLEYRLTKNGSHSCCHNWEKDEKKYLYGIRHMYGLEGARKSYTSVSCQRIQSSDSSCSEGGCPFKSFDDDKLIQLLPPSSDGLLLKIKQLKRTHQYTSACLLHLKSVGTVCDNSSFNFTPVSYYTIASKCDIINT